MNYKKIFLVGFMGTGKSAVAQLLANKLNWSFIDTDAFIEEQEKTSISQLFSTKGENYFRRRETEALGFLVAEKKLVLSTGGGIVLKKENIEIMQKNGLVILLKAKAETIYNRIKSDANRPLLNNNMSVEHIQNMLNSRDDAYNNAGQLIIETDEQTINDVVEIILNAVRKV